MPATPDVAFLESYRAESDTQPESSSSSSSNDAARKRRNVTIEDEDDMTPMDYGVQDVVEEDDEEGRFFGGGLTDEQSRLLDLVDQYEDEEASEIMCVCEAIGSNITL